MKTLSATEFSAVFHQGKVFFTTPIKLMTVVQPTEKTLLVAVGFAVPKRQIKKAVNRNRIKRMMRAAYQNIVREINFKQNIQMIFYYTEKKELPFSFIEEAMRMNIQQCLNLNPQV
jgi:ribonuclease P protein component